MGNSGGPDRAMSWPHRVAPVTDAAGVSGLRTARVGAVASSVKSRGPQRVCCAVAHCEKGRGVLGRDAA
ncbi:hypothetical protein KXD40_001117 [Peronospora effusa]|nr:hypothetical protein KXD40_001117 [Peronospora effusa]